MEVIIMHSHQDTQLLLFKELPFYNADTVGNSVSPLTFYPFTSLGDGLIAINTIGGIFLVVLPLASVVPIFSPNPTVVHVSPSPLPYSKSPLESTFVSLSNRLLNILLK